MFSLLRGSHIQKKTYARSYDEIFADSLNAIKGLGWELISSDKSVGKINTRTGVSLKSWGEDVSILVTREPTGESTISVSSQASSQIIDWGKSEENERVFHEKLKKTISTR